MPAIPEVKKKGDKNNDKNNGKSNSSNTRYKRRHPHAAGGRNMFQDDMNGKDESGVYEIKYGDHMFFVPKRMDDGVKAIMAIERICCRGFSFKRKRKKLIGFMRDIWAFAIDEDRREVAGRIEREFAG